jgi:thioredoxin reductase (NADPH)
MHSVVIVGGGPAALAAAVYALDKQLDVLLIAEDIGGKVGVGPGVVEQPASAYKVSQEASQVFERWMNARRDLVLRDRVVDIVPRSERFEVVTQRHGSRESQTVIIATGVTPLTLNVPGSRRWVGYGLGYSPTTYAHLLSGRNVAVVGTTARAFRGAIELSRTAAQVYIVLPEGGADSPMLRALHTRNNVVVLDGYQVTEIVGSEHVEQLGVERDGEGAFVPVDAVFSDLGLLPHSEMVRRITEVDAEGYIVVDSRHRTSVPGLFAAGDVCTRFSEQVVIALGDGARAAVSAYDYILEQSL